MSTGSDLWFEIHVQVREIQLYLYIFFRSNLCSRNLENIKKFLRKLETEDRTKKM